jgi:hypothetical protein
LRETWGGGGAFGLVLSSTVRSPIAFTLNTITNVQISGTMFLICLFLLPETLFDRPQNRIKTDLIGMEVDDNDVKFRQDLPQGERYIPPPMSWTTYLNRLWINDLQRPPSRRLKAKNFVVKPLSMLKYPSVAIPALYLFINSLHFHPLLMAFIIQCRGLRICVD